MLSVLTGIVSILVCTNKIHYHDEIRQNTILISEYLFLELSEFLGDSNYEFETTTVMSHIGVWVIGFNVIGGNFGNHFTDEFPLGHVKYRKESILFNIYV